MHPAALYRRAKVITMSTLLTVQDYLATIDAASARLRHDAAAGSLADSVPSCPGWSVSDLVGHHGGVMRWAVEIVAGGRTSNVAKSELDAVLAAPNDRRSLLEWHSEAAGRLCRTLEGFGDGPALVFLADAPAPRLFWARRQAHEATIHGVDAQSARLGHLPTAASTPIPTELAVDGIDELLTGFVPRRSSGLHTDGPVTLLVAPTDAEHAWTVTVGPDVPVTTRGATGHADATLTGSAVALYLGLWNRGDEIAEHGLAPMLGLWRDKVRIRWS